MEYNYIRILKRVGEIMQHPCRNPWVVFNLSTTYINLLRILSFVGVMYVTSSWKKKHSLLYSSRSEHTHMLTLFSECWSDLYKDCGKRTSVTPLAGITTVITFVLRKAGNTPLRHSSDLLRYKKIFCYTYVCVCVWTRARARKYFMNVSLENNGFQFARCTVYWSLNNSGFVV